MINTIDPGNVQAMLAKQFDDFGVGSERKAAFDPLIGHGIFTADGPAWQEARKLIRPCFDRKEMYDVSVFEEHVDRLVLQIPRDGTPTDLQDLFLRFTIDTATEFLFGRSSLTLDEGKGLPSKKVGAEFADAFNRTQRTIAGFFALGRLAFLIPKTQFRKDRKVVHEFVDQYIQDTLSIRYREGQKGSNESPRRGCYQFFDRFSRQNCDYDVLRNGLLHLLLAGRDSTASLLTNLWFVLARHPHVWRKLQEEVKTFDGAKPNRESLKQLKYLRHCINECTSHGPNPLARCNNPR